MHSFYIKGQEWRHHLNRAGQYKKIQIFPNLQFKKILKNSFHSIKLELRDSYGEKVPFNSVGVTRAVLMFRKILKIISRLKTVKNGC